MENRGLTMKDRFSLGKKMQVVMDYLQNGGELKVNGAVYVWLDNHIIREDVQPDGTINYLGIDGLAIKAQSYDTETKETKPYYIGQTDMPISEYVKLIENLTEEDWVGLTASNALHSMIPKR